MTTTGLDSVAVALDGITRTYKSRAGEVHALRGVTHTFVRGTFTAIMGPSGSGKSTLLQVAAGLDRPTRGEVVVGGRPLGRLDEAALTRLRRTSMGFVFQSYNLLDALTAYDNVALPARLAGQKVVRAAVLDALREVGLDGLAHRRPPELSGGQPQRVAIARALHTRPDVLFADEPTGALDSLTGEQVMDLLSAAAREHHTTVVLVTHEPRVAAYADREVIVRDGRVTACSAAVLS